MSRLGAMPAIVLLVEDDPGDQELTRRALQQNANRTKLFIVNDGEEAMDYLLRRGDYQDPESSPRPDLVLLDLNMPKLDGKRVLKQIRENQDLRRIPVVVLTTSQHEQDVMQSYDLGCNSYITKPADMDVFMRAIRELESYWLNLVILPQEVTV